MKQQQKQSSAIVERQKDALVQIPDYLQRSDGAPQAGLENMERSDMTLPRLGLCQSLSPQRIKSDPKYISGLEEGQYFNTITREIYGEKVQVVPLLFFKGRLLFKEDEGLRCRSDDSKVGVGDPGGDCARCPLQQWGRDGEPPECSLLYNYASLVIKDGYVSPSQLVVKSFKSSDLGAARDWNSLMRLRGTDAYAGIYEFVAIEAKTDKFTWFKTTVQNAGFVSKESFEAAKMVYEMVAAMNAQGRLRHDVEDIGSEEGAGER